MKKPKVPIEAVVIGGSAGAIEVLSSILPTLPAPYPIPIVVVNHIPPYGKSLLADIFRTKCKLPVKEVEDKELLASGTLYFAPPDYHVLVEQDRTLSLSSDEPVWFSRPSIDVLFESAADAFGESLLGVILTGASSDGAHGLKVLCDAGGTGLVQLPSSAQVSTMPESALQACSTAIPLKPKQISEYLVKISGEKI